MTGAVGVLPQCPTSSGNVPGWGGGGTRIIFWRGVLPKFWNPYPYLRIFLPQKRLIWLFIRNFRKSGPISKGFLPLKRLILQIFREFCEIEPSSKEFFWSKWDPCLRIFGQKVTHWAAHPRIHDMKSPGNVHSVSGSSSGTSSFLMPISDSTMLVKYFHAVLYSPCFW